MKEQEQYLACAELDGWRIQHQNKEGTNWIKPDGDIVTIWAEHSMQTNSQQTEGAVAVRSGDLLACPFCGGQWIPEHPKMTGMMPYTSQPKLEELTEGGWRVTCYGCGVGTWDNLKYTKEQAIAAWNTRRQANGGADLHPPPNNPKRTIPYDENNERLPDYSTRDALVAVIEKQDAPVISLVCEQLAEQYKTEYYQRKALLLATPAQLREALLRATEKWKE